MEMKEESEIKAITDDEEEKWVTYYSSFHQILLVGDGDFSFSLSLAQTFGSASNIVASSLDSYDIVIKKYKNAKANLESLEKLGVLLLHGVDATKMKLHTDLQMRKFDRIIFYFPHAGFHGKEDGVHLIKMHRNLVHGFFRNASGMLRANGEVHINHKTKAPFCHWNLQELASRNSLILIECVDIKIEDYPGYNNKRGASMRCDEPFPIGDCSTFKFIFSPTLKKPRISDLTHTGFLQLDEIPIQIHHQQPISVELSIRNECFRIFDAYFDYVVNTFGRIDYDVCYVREALCVGFGRYMGAAPGRTINGYISVLEELHRLSILRSSWLRTMLPASDRQL